MAVRRSRSGGQNKRERKGKWPFSTIATGIGILIAFIGLSLTLTSLYYHPDFGMEIKPMLAGVPVPPGGQVQTSISLYRTTGIPIIGEYNHPISLGASNLPPDVLFAFDPQDEIRPTATALLTIRVGPHVREDRYAIDIWASGSDGVSHSAKFILYVQNQTATGTIRSLPVAPVPADAPRIDVSNYFYPSGWMGNADAIRYQGSFPGTYRSYPDSIRITYTPPPGDPTWAGVYWLFPENNWGNVSTALDLQNVTKLTFLAKGEKGGEQAEFKVGGVGADKPYPDSVQPEKSTGIVHLTTDWQEFTIDLTDRDLHHVVGGFCWATDTGQNPGGATIYLDDIRYE